MKSTFVLAQTIENGSPVENIKTAVRLIKRAKEEFGADVVAFPEYFMSHYPLDAPRQLKISAAQSIDGPFVREMAQLARENSVWLIFGMSEITGDKDDDRVFNSVVVMNDRGETVSVYRKTHLYDAFGHKESDDVKPGDALFEPVETPFGKLGIFVCYELRFPEIARFEAAKGADIIVVPTAWVAGDIKSHHYRTLVTARALENTCYVLTTDMYGPQCIGETLAVDPMGIPFAQAGEGEWLLPVYIDTDRIAEVRKKLPSVSDRRPELYI